MDQGISLTLRRVLRFGMVIGIIGLFLLNYVLSVYHPSPDIPFDQWYGNWPTVIVLTMIFLFFVFFLTRPRRPQEWRGASLVTAFFISLFTEMFGVPLTIYLLAPLLGVETRLFGMHESHLWAYFLSQWGIMSLKTGVYLVMVQSSGLLVIGFSLLAFGWKEVHRGEGALVTTGIYATVRHSQYVGLILIVIAFLIMWPTVLTLLLSPFLIGRYLLLATEEEQELEEKFGEDFQRYKAQVPGFIPFFR